ncbi:phenylalanine--tRNA ligase subunit beta [Binucleata daphniae]
MPTVSIDKNQLHNALNKSINEDISELLFDFGLEIDDIVLENDETVYKIEVGANRYDLLCFEGISKALRAYLEIEEYEETKVYNGTKTIETKKTDKNSDVILSDYEKKIETTRNTIIQQNTTERPHIACAIIHNIQLTKETYDSFIDYQEKLNSSLGRNRSIIAIGTHDMSSVTFPVFYNKINKKDIKLAPLNQKVMTGNELIDFYNQDNKMRHYCKLLNEDFPVFYDAQGHILSVPPLINSDFSKISQQTTNIFVEVTGTDFNKVNTALKMILNNFRGDGYTPVTIQITDKKETSRCMQELNRKNLNSEINNKLNLNNAMYNKSDATKVTPYFYNNQFVFTKNEINNELGINITTQHIQKLLKKMMYKVTARNNESTEEIVVDVFDARNDVLHKVDIFEDIAIAYGYNNFVKSNPPILTIGHENSLSKFCNKIRHECAQAGYDEVLTLSLLSKKDSKGECITLSNPKSLECEVVRNSLLPGILKSIYSNQHIGVPIRIFEISDVVTKQNTTIKNQTNLCAAFVNKTDDLDNIIGLCTLIFKKVGLECELKECDNEIYFKQRSVNIMVDNIVVGTLGVLHPQLCNDFKIPFAISSFEMNLNMIYASIAVKK